MVDKIWKDKILEDEKKLEMKKKVNNNEIEKVN
jgi:hypothetical protein